MRIGGAKTRGALTLSTFGSLPSMDPNRLSWSSLNSSELTRPWMPYILIYAGLYSKWQPVTVSPPASNLQPILLFFRSAANIYVLPNSGLFNWINPIERIGMGELLCFSLCINSCKYDESWEIQSLVGRMTPSSSPLRSFSELYTIATCSTSNKWTTPALSSG